MNSGGGNRPWASISRTLVPTLVMWFYRNVEHYSGQDEVSSGRTWLRPLTAVQTWFENGFNRFRDSYRILQIEIEALRVADEYVWVYGEKFRWWPTPKPDSAACSTRSS